MSNARKQLEDVLETLPENVSRYLQLQLEVNDAILQERQRQNAKWGSQRHTMGKWLAILVEEVGEVAEAMQPRLGLTTTKPTDAEDLYDELIQVAAVAAAAAEQVLEERRMG